VLTVAVLSVRRGGAARAPMNLVTGSNTLGSFLTPMDVWKNGTSLRSSRCRTCRFLKISSLTSLVSMLILLIEPFACYRSQPPPEPLSGGSRQRRAFKARWLVECILLRCFSSAHYWLDQDRDLVPSSCAIARCWSTAGINTPASASTGSMIRSVLSLPYHQGTVHQAPAEQGFTRRARFGGPPTRKRMMTRTRLI